MAENTLSQFSLAVACCPCRSESVNGNHFGFQSVTIFRRHTSENGYVLVMSPQVTLEKILVRQFLRLMSLRWCIFLKTKNVPSNVNDLRKHFQPRDQRVSLMRQLGSYMDTRVLQPSGRKRRHHCLLQDEGAIFSREAAQSLSRTSGTGVSQWRDPVGL